MFGHDEVYDGLMEEFAINFNGVKCRCCGVEGLHWVWASEGEVWRLFDTDNKLHQCTVNPLPVEPIVWVSEDMRLLRLEALTGVVAPPKDWVTLEKVNKIRGKGIGIDDAKRILIKNFGVVPDKFL